MTRFVVERCGISGLTPVFRFHVRTFIVLVALAAGISSCSNDELLGLSVQPGQDRIEAFYDTVSVFSETKRIDSIYSRSAISYLGEFTDPFFGTSTCDFMAQLFCPYNLSFPDDVQRIDSAFLYMTYDSWFGDSTTLMHVNVYELGRPLSWEQAYFTNQDPSAYLTGSTLLGSASFTTGDMYSTAAERREDTYSTYIKVPINLALANRFLNDSRDPLKSSFFKSPRAFRNYFNGIYVSCDFGNGSIAYINHSELELCYGTTLESKLTGLKDSFVVQAKYFPVNKEVKLVNRFEHKDLTRSFNPFNPSDSLNYIYTPAGLYTRVKVPESLFRNLNGKTVNALTLRLNATQLDTWKFGMSPPTSLLLIRESDAMDFFKRYETEDKLYSFLAEYDSDQKCYTFNLSYYAQKMVRELADSTSTTFEPFTDMLLIPVTEVINGDDATVRLDQSLTPSAVKIKGWNHPSSSMKLEVVYSKGKHN